MRDFGLGYADGTSDSLVAHLRKCGFSDDVMFAARKAGACTCGESSGRPPFSTDSAKY